MRSANVVGGYFSSGVTSTPVVEVTTCSSTSSPSPSAPLHAGAVVHSIEMETKYEATLPGGVVDSAGRGAAGSGAAGSGLVGTSSRSARLSHALPSEGASGGVVLAQPPSGFASPTTRLSKSESGRVEEVVVSAPLDGSHDSAAYV